MIKPSYKTSEFWFTLVSFIFSGLFLLGIISDHDSKEELISTVSHAVESCILIGGQIAIFSKYVQSRKQQKIEHEKTKQKEQENISKELEEYVGIDKKYEQININTANIAELIQLPHIGPVLAKKIIDHRTENGDFEYIEQIIDVNGIGGSVYKDIEKFIIV